jgi:hypothetical protein
MTTPIVRAGILIACGWLAACSSTPAREPGHVSDLPLPSAPHQALIAKIQKQYPPNRYLLGIGLGESGKAATELARADLAKKIRVEVRMVQVDLQRERGGRTEQELSTVLETEVAELIKGIEIVEQGRDLRTGEAFAVAVLPKSEMQRILQQPRGQPDKLFPPIGLAPESKDGIWVTGEGAVLLGEDLTVAEAKARARDEARRHAVEQAVGTFVKGLTVVYNAQVAEDLVRSLVRGIVVEEQVQEEGVRQIGQGAGTPALQYVTRLRAKVRPVRVEHKGDFTVKTSLNKTVFQDGDEMRITATPSRDAHLYIFNVTQDDAVTVLFPNRFAEDSFVPAQKELVFPNEGQRTMGLRLRVFPPQTGKKAVERIKLIATTKKIDLGRGKFHEGVFQVYPAKETGLVTDLLKELALLEESEWTEATIPYEIRK